MTLEIVIDFNMRIARRGASIVVCPRHIPPASIPYGKTACLAAKCRRFRIVIWRGDLPLARLSVPVNMPCEVPVNDTQRDPYRIRLFRLPHEPRFEFFGPRVRANSRGRRQEP